MIRSSIDSSTLISCQCTHRVPERQNGLSIKNFEEFWRQILFPHTQIKPRNDGSISSPRTIENTHNSANWARKKRQSWERGYRPHYFLPYWAALKSSKAITGLSPTTQPSWPGGISYASPGPNSASLPSSRTVFNLPEMMEPT